MCPSARNFWFIPHIQQKAPSFPEITVLSEWAASLHIRCSNPVPRRWICRLFKLTETTLAEQYEGATPGSVMPAALKGPARTPSQLFIYCSPSHGWFWLYFYLFRQSGLTSLKRSARFHNFGTTAAQALSSAQLKLSQQNWDFFFSLHLSELHCLQLQLTSQPISSRKHKRM